MATRPKPPVVLAVIGNPRPDSRTHAAARLLVAELAAALGGEAGEEVDLAALGPRVLDFADAEVDAAVERVVAADVVVFASPTYKATYTGLFKGFCDRFPAAALSGSRAAALMLVGSADHRLAVEVHMTPLLHELGARLPVRGLAIAESELDGLPLVASEFAASFAAH